MTSDSDDLRDMMTQKMGVDPVDNLSDYLQVQFSNLPESEQRDEVAARTSLITHTAVQVGSSIRVMYY